MERLVAAYDWSSTSLGAPEQWPTSLRVAVDICLASQFQIIIFWSRELIQIYNDSFVAILGGKHPHALGRGARECWPEMWSAIEPLYEHVFTTGTATRSENIHLPVERHGYLEESFYTMSYTPLFTDDGSVGGVFNVVLETTAQVVAERRTRILRDLAAHTAVARTTEEACGRSIECLQDSADLRFALVYLAEADGTFGLTASCNVPPNSPALVPTLVGGRRETPWPLEAIVTSRGPIVIDDVATFGTVASGPWGHPVERAAAMVLLRAGADEPAGLLVVGLTPQRAWDGEFQDFVALVAGQVSTAITNARSYQEEKQRAEALAEIDRAKTVFFSNVSHEFRTPLTLILGPLEDALGADHTLRGPQLEAVHRNALRLLKLVNALLDFSRIEAGRAQPNFEPVQLTSVVRDVTAAFRSAIERCGLWFDVRCAELPEPVWVDRDMFEKVLLNLLSNALKFTFEGGIAVSLETEGQSDRAGPVRARLVVRDTGVGIPTTEQQRIFQRFQRIEASRARTHEGSGIGLSLVVELLRLHGGTISVSSELDVGTAFTVRLPFGKQHLPAEPAPARARPRTSTTMLAHVDEAMRWGGISRLAASSPESASMLAAQRTPPSVDADPCGPESRPLSSARILLADDNADMREYIARVLGEDGAEVEAVPDGLAALERARTGWCELILTDVMMPGLDGFGLLAAIRAEPALRKLPVIMLSARAGEEARVEGLATGADDYLVKPFSARELCARVRTHLKLARQREEAERLWQDLLTILRDAPLAVAFYRLPERRYEYTNEAHRALVGRDLTGEPVTADTVDGRQLLAFHDEVVRTGRTLRLREVPATVPVAPGREGSPEDTRTTPTDGSTTRYYDFTLRPWRDHVGTTLGVLGFGVDVSEQVDARRELATARQRLRNAVEAAGVGTWHLHLGTWLESRDARANEILGLPAQETTQPFEEFLARVHAQDRARVSAQITWSQREGERYLEVYRVVLPDGTIRWVRDHGAVQPDSAGRPQTMTGALIDITDQRVAEQALRLSRERLRAALDASDIGTYFWDVRAGTVSHDEGIKRLFGFEADEGEALSDYTGRVHPGDRQGWQEALEHSAQDAEDFQQEYRIIRPDGSIRWVLDKAKVVSSEAVPAYLAGAVVDITERKELEQRAVQANRAKDEFLAMLGHELRNPLSPMMTALQLMRLRGLSSREQDILERQVGHLTRLVDDLLDVSRITRGKIELRKTTVELADVIARAVEVASPLLEQRHHRLRRQVPSEGLQIYADPDRMAQVVANLLTNAAKYSEDRSTIWLEAESNGDFIELRVRDQGVGIAPEMIAQIFEPFIQQPQTIDRAKGGLGLGLAIVRSIVAQHGGRVWAHSDGVGKGSEFTLELPAVVVGQRPSSSSSQRRRRLSDTRSSLGPSRRILIVDDNVDAALTLRETMDRLGHVTEIAHDGPTALARAARFEPDVALLDIGLPVMDGYELGDRLRRQSARAANLTVIAISGYGQEADIRRSAEAGFQGHFVKPVDLIKLAEAIAALPPPPGAKVGADS